MWDALAGAVAIVVRYVRRLRSGRLTIERVAASRAGSVRRLSIASSVVLVSAASAAFSVLAVQDRDGTLGLELTLAVLVKSGLAALVVGVLVYASAWYVVRWSSAPTVRRSHSRR